MESIRRAWEKMRSSGETPLFKGTMIKRAGAVRDREPFLLVIIMSEGVASVGCRIEARLL